MSEEYTARTEIWAFRFGACWKCGKRGAGPNTLQIHHLVRGTSRQKNNLRTTAIACPKCHHAEHNGKGIGLRGWLKLKRQHDPAHFNLAEICRLRGRAQGAITEAEVDAAGMEGGRPC